MSKVYIIVLNYNNWNDTIECLESIYRSDYQNYEVVVVDNGSVDDSVDNIKLWANGNLNFLGQQNEPICFSFSTKNKPIRYKIYYDDFNNVEKTEDCLIIIKSNVNLGYAGGNNLGIKFAQIRNDFEYIWVLNNDTIVKEDTLSELVKKMGKNTSYGIVGSKIMYYDLPNKIQMLGGGKLNNFLGTTKYIVKLEELEKLTYISGTSLLISKKCIGEVGVFSEDYFLYYEDVDYSMRVREKGFYAGVALSSVVYHKEGRSTHIGKLYNNSKKNQCVDYLYLRNRVILGKKYLSSMWGVYISIFFSILLRIRKKNWSTIARIIRFLFCGVDDDCYRKNEH